MVDVGVARVLGVHGLPIVHLTCSLADIVKGPWRLTSRKEAHVLLLSPSSGEPRAFEGREWIETRRVRLTSSRRGAGLSRDCATPPTAIRIHLLACMLHEMGCDSGKVENMLLLFYNAFLSFVRIVPRGGGS